MPGLVKTSTVTLMTGVPSQIHVNPVKVLGVVNAWVSEDINSDVDDRSAKPNPCQPSEARKSLRILLDKLPKVPSHYCRSSSSKMYLEPIVTSMAQLHQLYVTDCPGKCN